MLMPIMPSHNNNNNNKSSSSINTTTVFNPNPNPPCFQSYPHSKFNKLHLFLLFLFSMSTSFILLYSLLFLSFSPSSSSALRHPHFVARATAVAQQACGATRFPDACGPMMSSVNASSTALDIIQAAFTVSAQNLNAGQGMVKDILSASAHDQNRSRASQTCLELLNLADSRAKASSDALANGKLKDARAWSSAALAYQYDCWSALKYVNNSAAVNSTMSFFDTTLIVSTSNALSMLRALDLLGKDPASWGPPKTERDGFWEPVLGDGDSAPGINFAGLSWDATVCKDGANGSYKSVQAAVDAAPENLQGAKRFVIKIKEGVYQETVRVPYSKTNVVFLGDGMGKTVITGSLNTGIMGITTYHTATVGILGDGFMASGVTFENTAGPNAHQAVAFRSDSDFSYIENCEFLGNQDTVYIHSLRQLYKSCRIVGNVDFIFGNAAAVFQDCSILVRPRQLHPEKGGTNSIAAHGRTDPAQTSGFVFLGCLINGTEEYMNFYRANPRKHKDYLGRPWKAYSRTVYVNCTMESIILPEGWLPWDGDFALSTLYYGEFGNSGPGADVSKRVPWSVQIPKERVSTYYVQNFLQGSGWTTTTS